MGIRTWLVATTLATVLMSNSPANSQSREGTQEAYYDPVDAEKQTQLALVDLGFWAKQIIDEHATIRYQEEIIINDMHCAGAYHPGTDEITLRNSFLATALGRVTLAHELVHAALDTTKTKGLFTHPQYSGPNRKAILAKTRTWLDTQGLEEQLEEHLDSITLQHKHEHTRDYRLIDTLAQQATPWLTTSEKQRIDTYLRRVERIQQRLERNHGSAAVETLYDQQNTALDHALDILSASNAYAEPRLSIKQYIHLKNALSDDLLTFKVFNEPTIRSSAARLRLGREEHNDDLENRLEQQRTYFTEPNESFARIIGSLHARPIEHSNLYHYRLDNDILRFLEDFRYKDKQLFEAQISEYRRALRQPADHNHHIDTQTRKEYHDE